MTQHQAAQPDTPNTPDPEPQPATPQADTGTTEQTLMHARLHAMAQPRPTDDPELAALRQVLRDPQIIAHVIANVDNWPPLTDDQRETIAALLQATQRRQPPRQH